MCQNFLVAIIEACIILLGPMKYIAIMEYLLVFVSMASNLALFNTLQLSNIHCVYKNFLITNSSRLLSLNTRQSFLFFEPILT